MSEAGNPSRDPRLSSARTKWFALGALAIAAAAFLFIAIGGIGENLVYYWGPKELRAAGSKATGAVIRLGGQVAVGSVKRGDGVSNLEFDVTMTKDGSFESRRLMVSHDNKYRAPGDKNVDIRELMRSTEGLDDAPAPRAAVAGSPP